MLLVSKRIVPALGELKVAEAAQFGASPPATNAAEPEPIAPSNNLLVSGVHPSSVETCSFFPTFDPATAGNSLARAG